MATTKEKLLGLVNQAKRESSSKVSIVGVGQVGMACAFAILEQSVCNEIALTDVMADKLRGEFMDLSEGMAFTKNVKIKADTDLKVTSNSDIIVITAGCRQRPEESRLELVQRNTEIYKKMIPKLAEYSPKAILLVVSNPVDILTYVTWKLSGFPANRVVGSGTNLDSARFRYYIGEKLDISPSSCHGWIIGEHGDSSVPVWSGVNVAGVNLIDLNPKLGQEDDPENWAALHTQIVQSAYEIIKCKGYTNWAIGLSVKEIVHSMIKNEHRVYALSTIMTDWVEANNIGIKEEVFMSIPCVVGHDGIHMKVSQTLNETEIDKFKKSVSALDKVAKAIKFD